jgi:hypothetical protein
MAQNSKDTSPNLDSAANVSQPEKPTFSKESGLLTDSELALLRKLAHQTAREVLDAESTRRAVVTVCVEGLRTVPPSKANGAGKMISRWRFILSRKQDFRFL